MRSPTGVLTPRSVAMQMEKAQRDAENQVNLANQRAARMVEVTRPSRQRVCAMAALPKRHRHCGGANRQSTASLSTAGWLRIAQQH